MLFALLILSLTSLFSHAWVISRVPTKLKSSGHQFVDNDGASYVITTQSPECYVLPATVSQLGHYYSDGLAPGTEIYLVVLSDPEHGYDGKDACSLANCGGSGCCQASTGTDYTQIRNGPYELFSSMFCVPKGYVGPNVNSCAAKYLVNGTKQYCQSHTDTPEGPINSENSQGDCYFSVEVFATTHKPASCKVEPISIRPPGSQTFVTYYKVIASGDDAALNGAELKAWSLTHTGALTCNNEEALLTTTSDFTQCSSYHSIAAPRMDTAPGAGVGNYYEYNENGEKVGYHCSGHETQDQCSSQQFAEETQDSGPLAHSCEIFGCEQAPMNDWLDAVSGPTTVGKLTCNYGDLLFSANFALQSTVSRLNLTGVNQPGNCLLVAEVSGSPAGTSSSVDSAPTLCCKGQPETPEVTTTAAGNNNNGGGTTANGNNGNNGGNTNNNPGTTVAGGNDGTTSKLGSGAVSCFSLSVSLCVAAVLSFLL